MEKLKVRYKVLFKKEVPEDIYSDAYSYTFQEYFIGTKEECIRWAEKEAKETGFTVYWIEEVGKKREEKPFPKNIIM